MNPQPCVSISLSLLLLIPFQPAWITSLYLLSSFIPCHQPQVRVNVEDHHWKEERGTGIYGAPVQGMLGISWSLHYIHFVLSNPVRQVKSLNCTLEIGLHSDSFLLSQCGTLGHWATSSGLQGVVGRDLRSDSFSSCLSNYVINRAPLLWLRSSVTDASAHTACQVSGSLTLLPCGILSLWLPACSDFGVLILICPWVSSLLGPEIWPKKIVTVSQRYEISEWPFSLPFIFR